MEPTKLLLKNAKTLKDLENGMSDKRLAEKNDVSRNTLSTWMKNKKNLLASLEKKGTTSKRQKLEISKR